MMDAACFSTPSLFPDFGCTLAFVQERWSSELFPRLVVTLVESLAGLAIAVFLAVGGATLASVSTHGRRLIDGLAIASQVIPPVVGVPLLLYLPFGSNWGVFVPRVALAAAFAAYPAYQILHARLRRIEAATRELFLVYPATRSTKWFRVLAPLSIPDFFVSLQIATPLAVAGAVVGEWATGAGSNDRGLASTFMVAARNLYPNQAAGALTVLVVLTAGLYAMVLLARGLALGGGRSPKYSLD